MINNDRIIPITKVDYLTLISQVLDIASVSVTKLAAAGIGEFEQDTNSAAVLCAEPVDSFNFGSSVTAATVYFVADYGFAGFTKTGATLTVTGTVDTESAQLYKATLSTNALTIAKVGL
jgi:hypothetical protein